MAGAKETPRQKMIGMMYLVLTALLALNVSKSILESFVRVNDSLVTTNQNFDSNNTDTYNELEGKYLNNKQKVKDEWAAAKEVRDSAENLFEHIDSIKAFLLKQVEGLPSMDSAGRFPLAKASGKANYDVPTNKMGVSTPTSPDGGTYTAKELHKMIDRYREYLFGVLDDPELGNADTSSINLNLKTKGNPNSSNRAARTWEGLHFYHAPLAAAITALTKIQSDIQNAEAQVINRLLEKVGAKKFNIDTVAPKVVPNSNYIAVGDTYRAEVVVAAWSSTKEPGVRISRNVDSSGALKQESKLDSGNYKVEDGMGIYEFAPDKAGNYKWGGEIGIPKPGGDTAWHTIPRQQLRAAKQNVVVSPTKMNVVYRGLDNPISVSVPGMAAEDLQATMSNGSMIQKGPGQYVAKPGRGGGTAVVSVSDKESGRKLGDMKFRVQDVPRPMPFFAGKTLTDNSVGKSRLKIAKNVQARLEDFLFEGVNFDVVEFQVGATVGGQFPTEKQEGSNKLTSRQKSLLKNVERGGRVEVRNIVAIDPSGQRRNLPSLSLQIK